MKKARDLFEGPMAPVEEPITKPAPTREAPPARPGPDKPEHHPDNPFRRRMPHTRPIPKPKACGTCEHRARQVVNNLLAS